MTRAPNSPGRSPAISAAKLALTIKKLRSEIADIDLLQSEPIAVVGIGCRFPGGIHSPEDYWQLLLNQTDTIREIPLDRWSAAEWYDPDPMAPGKTNTRWGSFLNEVEGFDPAFFGIAPREAPAMDPQQRLLLEVTWEALWEAGLAPDRMAGSRTGVFVAICNTDYSRLLLSDACAIGPNSLAGASQSIASGRISYLLDLQGPSVSIDTACSSSLVAVHLACQSLRAGECDTALAGGVALHLTHEHYIALAKLGMLSSDGRCRTFDARANGFVPGEGCGVVVLKRLVDALADGDQIHAVIRGTATVQDGRTNVMTAPNGLAQQEVVKAALHNARVAPEQISYVETHGTGTALGDPIEVEALGNVLSGTTSCALGAVKTNLGHLEAAAGIAGLIKAVLALEHEQIPPNLHFEHLNPLISLEETRFFVPTEATPWPRSAVGRFAGVSAFGFGGTNAHVVLEEAPRLPKPAVNDTGEAVLLPISARRVDALEAFAREYYDLLENPSSIAALCRTAAVRRSHYEERLAVTGSIAEALRDGLRDLMEGRTRLGASRGRAEEDGGIVFVCSGQGSQWARMGVGLLQRYPVFRTAIEECDEVIRRLAGWSLLEQLEADETTSRLDHTEYAQPAIVAIEIALARLWESWGIVPVAVIGHSVGEIAAAHLAGALELSEAMRVVLHRGRLMERATGTGRMVAVFLSAADVEREIARFGNQLSVAAVNSPQSTVISGESAAVDALVAEWRSRGVDCRPLPVDYAFHSAQMEPFRDELIRVLGTVDAHQTQIPMISTVTGAVVAGPDLDAAYWGRNVRQPVLFGTAIQQVLNQGLRTIVEIGAHPVLATATQECLSAAEHDGVMLPSLRRKQDESTTLLTSLGSLYTRGATVDWTAVYPGPVPIVPLPTYPYQRQRYWTQRATAPVTPVPATARFQYRIRWHLHARDEHQGRTASAGHWLVIDDARGTGDKIRQTLQQRGESCVLVSKDTSMQSLSVDTYRGVIDLSSLDVADSDIDGGLNACKNTLELVQALARQGGEPPALWIVTRGAQAVTADSQCPGFAQAGVLGLARTIAIELPDLRCTTVDLDPSDDVSPLVDELLLSDGEDRVVFRGSDRYVPRLESYTPSVHTHAPELRSDATYLITGGLGGIGLRMARWLADQGAKSLVLLGRSAPSAHAREGVDAIRASGVEVAIYPVNVAHREELAAVLDTITRSMPPLRGIIHAAGTLDDGVLVQQTWDRFVKVLAPKIQGTWNLHTLTSGIALDFFVLCSSVSSVFGSPGQGAYAAGNAFLDALAAQRHATGLAGLSINWGAWAEVGMAARVEEQGQRRVLGAVRPMSPAACLTCLEQALSLPDAEVIVVDADWSAWTGPAPSLLRNVIRSSPPTPKPSDVPKTPSIVRHLESVPDASRHSVVVGFIAQEARRVLGLGDTFPIDERQPLLKLGLDSLMAVELRNRLAAALERPLPATLLFDYPSPAVLADFLLGVPARVKAEKSDLVLQDIAALSDEEAERLLEHELGLQ